MVASHLENTYPDIPVSCVTRLCNRYTKALADPKCYPTDEGEIWCLATALKEACLPVGFTMMDPCCGTKNILSYLCVHWVDRLPTPVAYDISPAAPGVRKGDACLPNLWCGRKVDLVITSPPFELADIIVPYALSAARICTCLHLPADYLTNGPVYRQAFWSGLMADGRVCQVMGLPRNTHACIRACVWYLVFASRHWREALWLQPSDLAVAHYPNSVRAVNTLRHIPTLLSASKPMARVKIQTTAPPPDVPGALSWATAWRSLGRHFANPVLENSCEAVCDAFLLDHATIGHFKASISAGEPVGTHSATALLASSRMADTIEKLARPGTHDSSYLEEGIELSHGPFTYVVVPSGRVFPSRFIAQVRREDLPGGTSRPTSARSALDEGGVSVEGATAAREVRGQVRASTSSASSCCWLPHEDLD